MTPIVNFNIIKDKILEKKKSLKPLPGRLQALWVACYEDGKRLHEVKVDRSLIMLGDITPEIRIDSFNRFKKAINKGYIEITSYSKKAEAEDEYTASL